MIKLVAQTCALLLTLCPLCAADATPAALPVAPAPINAAPVEAPLPLPKPVAPAVKETVPATPVAKEEVPAPAAVAPAEAAPAVPVVTAAPAPKTADAPATSYTTYMLIVAVIGFLRWAWTEYKALKLTGKAKTAEGTLEAVLVANDSVLTKDEKQDTGEVVEKVKGGIELLDAILKKNGMLGKSKG